jgi:hypothetical protein
MSKSACPPRARGAHRIYAYAARLNVAIYAYPSLNTSGTAR